MFREITTAEITLISGGEMPGGTEPLIQSINDQANWNARHGSPFGSYTGLGSSSSGYDGGGAVSELADQDEDGDGIRNADDSDYDAPDRFVGFYQDSSGIFSVFIDPLTGALRDFKISDRGGNGGWEPVLRDTGGYFASAGGGMFGGVFGVSAATNPFDLGIWAGTGTPGVSTALGWTGDSASYLNGPAASATMGAGVTVNAQTGEVIAAQVGTPGASATYGVSARAAYESAVQAARAMAQGWYDRYVGPTMEPYNYPPPPLSGQQR